LIITLSSRLFRPRSEEGCSNFFVESPSAVHARSFSNITQQ
jgi:hypothetical protein